MSGRLIQLSGVVIDLVYRVTRVPAPGTEAVVHGCDLFPGGGFNAMIAAGRQGMAVAHAGTLGRGPFATLAHEALVREGIGHLGGRDDLDQGVCVVLVDDDGERTFVYHPGADGQVSDVALSPQPGDWLLLSGYGLLYPGAVGALTAWLERGGTAPLVFDPSTIADRIGARPRAAALARATWITANRTEALALTGIDDPTLAARALARGRAGGAIVRDGARGAWLATAMSETHIPAHPVIPVDTNGAGDAHVGAFIAALARGEAPDRALRIANTAAALSTLLPGPATCPTLSATLAAMSEGGPP